MKHPNGYGTCAKLSGNRRNPFVVRKTKGWDDRGYPIYDTIGYFPTREAGLIALAEYNRSPYDVDANKITFEELYEKWLDNGTGKLGKSNLSSLKAAFKHCSNVHKMKYKEIRAYHMQDCIDNCGRSYSTQWAIKNLFNHLDRYAIGLDIIIRSFSQLTTAESIPETSKKPFTDDEVTALWKISDEPWVDSVLIFLYSGWRISELLGMKREDVDIEAGTMKGGVKTKSGKGRVVPIHSKVFEFVKRRYDEGGEYLFTYNGKRVSTSQYYIFWGGIMEAIQAKHTVHECRHTFRTRLDGAGANKVCIDRLMGHSGGGTGEKVYTHKTLDELKTAIELITN